MFQENQTLQPFVPFDGHVRHFDLSFSHKTNVCNKQFLDVMPPIYLDVIQVTLSHLMAALC